MILFLGLLYILPESHSPRFSRRMLVAKSSGQSQRETTTEKWNLTLAFSHTFHDQDPAKGVWKWGPPVQQPFYEENSWTVHEKPLGFTRFSDKVTLRLRWVNISGTPRSEVGNSAQHKALQPLRICISFTILSRLHRIAEMNGKGKTWKFVSYPLVL